MKCLHRPDKSGKGVTVDLPWSSLAGGEHSREPVISAAKLDFEEKAPRPTSTSSFLLFTADKQHCLSCFATQPHAHSTMLRLIALRA